MEQSLLHRTLRDIAAVLVVAMFMFPLFWWALTSIKPMYAIFNKDKVVVFDFVPTLINYAVVLLGWSRSEIAIESGSTFGVGGTSSYDSRQTIIDSIIVSVGSTALTMVVAVLAAYALSRMAFKSRNGFLNWVLGQRFMPPTLALALSGTDSVASIASPPPPPQAPSMSSIAAPAITWRMFIVRSFTSRPGSAC